MLIVFVVFFFSPLEQLCYPHHPTEVQAYVGIYTWQAVLIDDRIGEFKAEVEGYQRRFFAGEEQPTPLLRAAAALMRETCTSILISRISSIYGRANTYTPGALRPTKNSF